MSNDTANSRCFQSTPRDFLICITVRKASQLAALNADTYVQITLHNSRKRTKIFPKSSNPFYNEYFVIELHCSTADMLRQSVLFEIKRTTISCRFNATPQQQQTIGELSIELESVWNHNAGHMLHRKWFQLHAPFGKRSDYTRGYIQIDLSIVSTRNQPQLHSTAVAGEMADHAEEDRFGDNKSNKDESKLKNILIGIYKGVFPAVGDYCVRCSMDGISVQTRVVKDVEVAEWHQQIRFESVAQHSKLLQCQVISCDRMVGHFDIHMDQIAFDENPATFGPTYVHIYKHKDKSRNPSYAGRILISVRCEWQKNRMAKRIATKQTLAPSIETKLWRTEPLQIECIVLQADFIHTQSDQIEVIMKFAEFESKSLQMKLQSNRLTSDLKYYSIHAWSESSMSIKMLWPDVSLKYEADFFLRRFLAEMRNQMETFDRVRKQSFSDEQERLITLGLHLKSVMSSLVAYYRANEGSSHLQYHGPMAFLTDWDKNRLKFLGKFFDILINYFETMAKSLQLEMAAKNEHEIEEIYTQIRLQSDRLNAILATRVQDVWPQLMLEVRELKNNRRQQEKCIGYASLDSHQYVWGNGASCRGELSALRHQILIKPIDCLHTCGNDCGCIFAKFDCIIWMGSESDCAQSFLQPLQIHLSSTASPTRTHAQVTVNLFQAKISPGRDRTGLCDAKLRFSILQDGCETDTRCKSLSPVWDQSMRIDNLQLPGPMQWYCNNRSSPVWLAVEVFDEDDNNHFEYLGCGWIAAECRKKVRFHDGDDQTQLPEDTRRVRPLKWISIWQNGCKTAEVLMSCQMECDRLLMEMKRKNDFPSAVVRRGLPIEIRPVMKRFKIEIKFIGLRNLKLNLISTIRHDSKITILFGSLQLESGLGKIKRNRRNINCQNIYASGVVFLAEQFEYWPSIVIKHIVGKKAVGAAMIPDSNKYFATSCLASKKFIPDAKKTSTTSLKPEHSDKGNESLTKKVIKYFSTGSAAVTEKSRLLEHSMRSFTLNSFKDYWKSITNTDKLFKYTAVDDSCESELATDYTWWTKFYYSQQRLNPYIKSLVGKQHLIIYPSELERQPEFEYFQDWAESISLVRGLKDKATQPAAAVSYCQLKCKFQLKSYENGVKRSPRMKSLHNFIPIVVRVYVVQGLNLRSHDKRTPPDAYIRMKIGRHMIADRRGYVRNQSAPVFGRRYQLNALIPRDTLLAISLVDRGAVADSLIGTTIIDLEDRYRTRYRATVGLPNAYSRHGYNMWRDSKPPSRILSEICESFNLPEPIVTDTSDGVFIGKTLLSCPELETKTLPIPDDDDCMEHLSLYALKNLRQVPEIGFGLVPEHVETRALYHPERPGIEQGKLQLWVELFDADDFQPEPIDITPEPAQSYELRVIVYNTADVQMNERNLFGTKMSDIYVIGWIESTERAQRTDIHYRSLTGSGNFNWRMIFPFKYSRNEDMIVVTKRRAFQEVCETKMPAFLTLQVWDLDRFTANDFLGALELNLSNLAEPSKTKSKCSLEASQYRRCINLFREGRVRGWFPCTGHAGESGSFQMAGKIELELEILTDKEAALDPAGLGRQGPKALNEPERPETSFNPLTNPMKSIKMIVLPACKKCFMYIIIFCIVLLVAFVVMKKILSKFLFL